MVNVFSYSEMQKIAEERAAAMGLLPGVKIKYKQREGIFRRVNPFFYADNDLGVYVDLEARGRAKVRRHFMVMASDLAVVLGDN